MFLWAAESKTAVCKVTVFFSVRLVFIQLAKHLPLIGTEHKNYYIPNVLLLLLIIITIIYRENYIFLYFENESICVIFFKDYSHYLKCFSFAWLFLKLCILKFYCFSKTSGLLVYTKIHSCLTSFPAYSKELLWIIIEIL